MVKKTIVFDLDGTICFPWDAAIGTYEKYGLATPNFPVINAMKKLKERGYYIIIHTARRMLTHGGDVEKVIKDVGQTTEEWLEIYGVPYDELVFGKPYAKTYYVDDKALLPEKLVSMVDENEL